MRVFTSLICFGIPILAASGAEGSDSYFLLVNSCTGSRVIRYELPTGAPFDHLVAQGISPLHCADAMTIGPDGMLYVCSCLSNSVLRFDLDTGQYKGEFIPPNSGGLDCPIELIFRGDYAYVSSLDADAVFRFDAKSGSYVDAFVPAGAGGLNGPLGMAFGPNGDLFVASAFNASVKRYSGESGAYLGDFIVPGAGGLNAPRGLLFVGDHLLVSGMSSNSVVRFGLDGGLVDVLIPPSAGVTPFFIRLGPDGMLYVASASTNSVVCFNPETGVQVSVVVPPGSGALLDPHDVLFAPRRSPACSGDLNGDGLVDGVDLGLLLAKWGLCDE